MTALRCAVTTITAISDIRDKTDVQPLDIGLDFIKALNPIKWKWNMRDGRPMPGTVAAGFSAQELLEVERKFKAEKLIGSVNADNENRLEAAPIRMLPALVKAVQELAEQVATLQAARA